MASQDTEEKTINTKKESSTSNKAAVSRKNTKSHQLFSGRRKTAVATAKLIPGDGKITINKKNYDVYFTTTVLQHTVRRPLMLLKQEKKYDIMAKAKGGGKTGQAEALLLAISKALSHNSKTNRQLLRSQGFLTRDSRMVERKKYGLHKARRAVQFSKPQ